MFTTIYAQKSLKAAIYPAITEGNRLVVSASDMFSFIAASDYLTRKLFADAEPVIM